MVERLREAAAIAVERGAPDAALAHLQRAQAEPPAPELRSALTLELGVAAEFVRGTAAAEALAAGARGAHRPASRAAWPRVMLARTLLFMENPGEAMAVVDAARAELPAEQVDLDLALRAIRVVGVFFGVADPANLAELARLAAPVRAAHGPGAKTLTAITSLAVAVAAAATRTRPRALAVESLEGDEMPRFDRGTFTVLPAAVLAMADPAAAEPEWRRIRALAGRRGSVLDAIGADLWGGLARDLDGRPGAGDRAARARDGGRDAVRQRRQRAHGVLVGVPGAGLARARRSRAGLGGAAAAAAISPAPSDGERFWMISHAELLLADGELRRVAAITRARWRRRARRTRTRCGRRGAPCAPGPPRGRAIRRLRRASRAKSWRSLAAAPRRGSWGAHCASTAS